MCTISIKVDDNLLSKAWANMEDSDADVAEWMQRQIEAILLEMTLAQRQKKEKPATAPQHRHKLVETDPVPDVVLSLLGAGKPLADDDLNARNAYYQHLQEKHQ